MTETDEALLPASPDWGGDRWAAIDCGRPDAVTCVIDTPGMTPDELLLRP